MSAVSKPRTTDPGRNHGAGGSTRAADRALALLEAVTDAPDATLTELARVTELSPATASRLLATLGGRGFVTRAEQGGYRAGPRLEQMAAAVLREQPLYDRAGPHLAALAAETGETANLGVAVDEERVVYLRQVASARRVHTVEWTGRTIPRSGTAIGAVLAGDLAAGGYAARRRTIEPDITAVAAPVYGPAGAVVGALNVIAPSYRTTDEDIERYGRALVRHAAELSVSLGGGTR